MVETAKMLASGSVKDDYVLDDDSVLYYAPRGEKPSLALPRTMETGVFSVIYTYCDKQFS